MSASYFYYSLSEKLSRVLSRSQAYHLSKLISWWVYRSSKSERITVLENLKYVLSASSPADQEHQVFKNYQNFGRYCVDLLYDGRESRQNLVRRTRFRNLSRIDEALSKKNGAILLTAHLGNWELGAMALAAKGYSLSIIVKDHPDSRVKQLFDARRKAQGLKLISSKASIKRSLKALKNNELIGLTGDRLYDAAGVDVDFLGRKVKLPRGPFFLSLSTGAPIIGVLMKPALRGKGYEMMVSDVLYPPKSHTPTEIQNGYESAAKLLENMIRDFPLDWFCFEKYDASR